MSREIVISETDKIAVVLENGTVNEFFLSEGDQFVGDIIFATVESIVPAIEASFLNIGREKSGFIHVSDLPSSRKQQSGIRQFLKPQQPLLVQVTREPTGNKGACLTGYIQLPGRFLVLTPFERRIGLSKRIYDARERARLARIARMICGSGYGIVLRPEAIGQSEQALRDDLKLLLGRWKSILATSEKQTPGTTLYRDQDILERILREGSTHSVSRIIVDNQETHDRAMKYFDHWSDTRTRSKLRLYKGDVPVMNYYGVFRQLESAIQPLVHLPSGGTLVIQPTEALTSIDINTSSATANSQPETILKTNCEAAEEIARQLVLRDIGGIIVIDFIDMDNPRDQQIVWTKLSNALHGDKAQPQISYFSEFGLVEMTRRRQRQRLSEMLTMDCPSCQGIGRIRNMTYRADILTGEGMKSRLPTFLSAPVSVQEEKSTSYKSGVEKPKPKERERGNKGRRAQKQAAAPGSTQQTRSAPPPAAPPAQPKKKEKLTENINDLLFDENYFTAPIDDAFLEQFIEREDKLNVSSKLADDLDKLLQDIEENGLDSILNAAPQKSETDANETEVTSEEKVESETDSQDSGSEPEPVDIESTPEEKPEESETSATEATKDAPPVKKGKKADKNAPQDDSNENASSEEAEVVEEPKQPKKKPSKKVAKKTVAKKTTKKVAKKAVVAQEAKAEGDETEEKTSPTKPKAKKKAVEEPSSEAEPVDAAENTEVIIADETSEEAPTTEKASVPSTKQAAAKASISEPNKTTRRRVVKKLLTKRRSIRSFRPKK